VAVAQGTSSSQLKTRQESGAMEQTGRGLENEMASP
jgi:hypothetical protein